jgi:hypothetical protein
MMPMRALGCGSASLSHEPVKPVLECRVAQSRAVDIVFFGVQLKRCSPEDRLQSVENIGLLLPVAQVRFSVLVVLIVRRILANLSSKDGFIISISHGRNRIWASAHCFLDRFDGRMY